MHFKYVRNLTFFVDNIFSHNWKPKHNQLFGAIFDQYHLQFLTMPRANDLEKQLACEAEGMKY